jgi:predicted dehydrogenase
VSEQRLRVGVIGTGYGAAVHIPGLRMMPEVDVVAVCATTREHALRAASRYRIDESFDDYREMLRRCDLDAVTIAVPPEQQHPVVIACAEHSVHMLCEKPMGSSAAEARDMHRLVEDAGLVHAVNFQSRYVPSRARFKELVDKGYLGDLESVAAIGYRLPWRERRAENRNWVDDGERSAGLLNAVGAEYVDVLRWCFGEYGGVAGAVSREPAQRANKRARESSFSMLLRFASGASGTVHVSSAAAVTLGEEVVATGTDGMLILQSDGKLFGARRDERRVTELTVPEIGESRFGSQANPRLLPFAVLAGDWVRRILSGETSSVLPSFYDGMKVQEVLHGVQRSEELSRWIDLSEKKWPVQR